MNVLGFLFRSVFWVAVIATPLLSVWVASSLATFLDGPRWLAIVAGAALFPGLPLVWELWAHHRFSRKNERVLAAKGEAPQRWLTTSDRLILRTLFVNILFLSVLIGVFPRKGFQAVSARGDWFLDGVEPSPIVDHVRKVVFASAEHLQWSYDAVSDNEYDTEPEPRRIEQAEIVEVAPSDDVLADGKVIADVDTVPEHMPEPTPEHDAGMDGSVLGTEAIAIQDAAVAPPERPEPPEPKKPDDKKSELRSGLTSWPLANTLHPLVVGMPASAETSIESVGAYLSRETDPLQRVKAIHDYIADRIAYDLSSNTGGGSQDAEVVFKRGTAVCAGYALLAEAPGKVTGDEILYVVGLARTDKVGGEGHAWNAVNVGGRWYLMDITWDAGEGDGVSAPFKKEYRTDYLFTPPKVFVADHLADRDDLQILTPPVSNAEWMRLPKLRPGFHKQGLELISPTRSQTNVGIEGKIQLKNPRKCDILATSRNIDSGKKTDCAVSDNGENITCRLSSGRHQIEIFAGPKTATTLWQVGEFEMISN